MDITDKDIKEITILLGEEYTKGEVEYMLDSAVIEKSSEGVTVTYDNGMIDTFLFEDDRTLAYYPSSPI